VTIETKGAARIGYNGFLFPHEYSGDLHLCTHAEEENLHLTNVVMKILGKLVHRQTALTTFFYFINFNIIIIQVRYITIETKEVTRIWI
jgi:hypothetical protein